MRHSVLADAAPRTDSKTVSTCQGYPLQLAERVKTDYIKYKALNGNTNKTAWGIIVSAGGAVGQMGGQAGFWEKCLLLGSLPREPVEAEWSRGQGRLQQRCGGNRLPLSRRPRNATEAVVTWEKEIHFLLWREIGLSEPSRLLDAL